MKLIRANNRNELSLYGADIITDKISELLSKQKRVILAIAGGRSVSGIFQILKKKANINWSKVHIFMVDEKLVSLKSPDSNYKLAYENFIESLIEIGRIPEQNVHPFIYDKYAEDKGVGKYKEELDKLGGKYDILLLSSGEDGHIGAIYSNHIGLTSKEPFITMDDGVKPPKDRMTMTKSLLLKSQVGVLLFLGDIKKLAFNKFMDDEISEEQCPAKLVKRIKDSFVITDIND
jgi:6-phosphogluconolactonase